jgi:hypothetical protein
MKFIIFIFIPLLFASCFSIKPQVTKTGSNLWEDFFVSPGVMQYFIKPLSFHNKEQNLDIDFTFRNVSDSVTVNFSVFSNQKINKLDSLIISNELTTISICNPKTLISEYVNKKHKLRQTGKISLNKFKALTKNNNWTITTQHGNLKDQYFLTQKTKNNIEKIDNNLMIQLIQ